MLGSPPTPPAPWSWRTPKEQKVKLKKMKGTRAAAAAGAVALRGRLPAPPRLHPFPPDLEVALLGDGRHLGLGEPVHVAPVEARGGRRGVHQLAAAVEAAGLDHVQRPLVVDRAPRRGGGGAQGPGGAGGQGGVSTDRGRRQLRRWRRGEEEDEGWGGERRGFRGWQGEPWCRGFEGGRGTLV